MALKTYVRRIFIFWHVTNVTQVDNVTGPSTAIMLLLNGLHGQDQSNGNGYLPQNN